MTTTDAIHEILDKINAIYMELRFIRNIVEKRLVGEDETLEDEIEAMREYEERREKREVEFVPLKKSLENRMFRIFIEKRAKKELERLDEKTRQRILDALIVLRDEGFSQRIPETRLITIYYLTS